MSRLRNHIALVLDESSSMWAFRDEVIKTFNKVVESIRQQASDTNQDTTVSYITFANNARLQFSYRDVKDLQPMEMYSPGGSTALMDGVGMAIDTLRNAPYVDDPNTSFLVITITDGKENMSSKYDSEKVARMLRETQQTDRWTFGFQMPPGYGGKFSRIYDIPNDNIFEWEGSHQGFLQTSVASVGAVANYYTARSNNFTSTKNLYTPVTTDLSKVDTTKVKSQLQDISHNFKKYEVPKEMMVKDFVEQKTKKPYVIGAAYYQLMKTEKVQPTKEILIVEKGKKTVWGGQEARDLIGLPRNEHVKVSPGNHSNFDIFVQSTSVNRKLPRGTHVLIDVTRTTDATPTWTAPQTA